MPRICRHLPLWFLATCVAVRVNAGPAGPAEAVGDTESARAPSFGVLVTRGFADTINDSSDIDYGGVGVRASFPIGAARTGFRSAVAFEVIPALRFDQESEPHAGGFHILYEGRFAKGAPLTLVLRAGAGMFLADRPVPPEGTRHNFSLFAGAGVDVAIGARRSLELEYRFHHLSNANTGDFNPGINAHALVAALSYRLEP